MNFQFEQVDERLAYERIKNRHVHISHFLHIPTLLRLGVYEGVDYLLNRGLMARFMVIQPDTFAEISVEFLSTVKMYHRENYFTFRLGGNYHQMTYDDLFTIFGFMKSPNMEGEPSEQEVTEFWFKLTDSVWKSSGNKISHIKHLGLRLIARMINTNLLGLGEANQTNKTMVKILYTMSPTFHHS